MVPLPGRVRKSWSYEYPWIMWPKFKIRIHCRTSRGGSLCSSEGARSTLRSQHAHQHVTIQVFGFFTLGILVIFFLCFLYLKSLSRSWKNETHTLAGFRELLFALTMSTLAGTGQSRKMLMLATASKWNNYVFVSQGLVFLQHPSRPTPAPWCCSCSAVLTCNSTMISNPDCWNSALLVSGDFSKDLQVPIASEKKAECLLLPVGFSIQWKLWHSS